MRKGQLCSLCRKILFWDPIEERWYCRECEEDE